MYNFEENYLTNVREVNFIWNLDLQKVLIQRFETCGDGDLSCSDTGSPINDRISLKVIGYNYSHSTHITRSLVTYLNSVLIAVTNRLSWSVPESPTNQRGITTIT